MAQRRFHSKSRYGCAQCKQTRKKCDEIRPQCGRCKRIGQDCSLSDNNSNLVFISNNPKSGRKKSSVSGAELSPRIESTASSTASSEVVLRFSPGAASNQSPLSFTSYSDVSVFESIPIPNFQFTQIERERLRLMHHYALNTAQTLVDLSIPKNKDPTVWTEFVIELAFENDMILHGLLSLSALHLALRGVSKRKNTILAIHHHDLGLSLFRPYLSDITDQNYDAIFAFNMVVMLNAFGIQRISQSTTNAITKIRQVLKLVYDARPITKSHMELLRNSRWSILVQLTPFPSPEETLPADIEAMISKLSHRVSTVARTSAQTEIYIATIQSLRYSFVLTRMSRSAHFILVIFAVIVPGQYWDMLEKGDPLALAILANYAVTLYWIRNNIWLEGWGEETIDAVREALPPEWQDCIAWAIQEISPTMETSAYNGIFRRQGLLM